MRISPEWQRPAILLRTMTAIYPIHPASAVPAYAGVKSWDTLTPADVGWSGRRAVKPLLTVRKMLTGRMPRTSGWSRC